ncbi:MAG TPA: HupE/UreJ family protein, partial [Pirellulales bacterium]
MFRPRSLVALLAFVCLTTVLASPALAHPGAPGHEFVDGLEHPIFGLDHLLAMVAVGLLAVRIGGRAVWAMPGAFLASMLAGGLAASAGLPLPGVEYVIMASVLVLGVLIAATRIAPLSVAAGLVALFAFFHGYAHAAELVSGGSLGAYAGGFLLTTALLNAVGVLAGLALSRLT